MWWHFCTFFGRFQVFLMVSRKILFIWHFILSYTGGWLISIEPLFGVKFSFRVYRLPEKLPLNIAENKNATREHASSARFAHFHLSSNLSRKWKAHNQGLYHLTLFGSISVQCVTSGNHRSAEWWTGKNADKRVLILRLYLNIVYIRIYFSAFPFELWNRF